MGCKKQGAKNQGKCYSKREEAVVSLLFLNNNDPVFLHPAFCNPQFGPDFFRVTNRPMFSKQEQWVQIDWANMQWNFVKYYYPILSKKKRIVRYFNLKCIYGFTANESFHLLPPQNKIFENFGVEMVSICKIILQQIRLHQNSKKYLSNPNYQIKPFFELP